MLEMGIQYVTHPLIQDKNVCHNVTACCYLVPGMQECVRERDEPDGHGFPLPLHLAGARKKTAGHLPSAKTKWKHSGAGSMRRSRMAASRWQARENRCFSFWGRLLLAGHWLRATLLSHTHAGLLAAEQQQSHHCEAFCPLAAQSGGPAGGRDKRPLNIASLAVLGKGSACFPRWEDF